MKTLEENDWLTHEELNQLPVDTLLLVTCDKLNDPVKQYFSHYKDGMIWCFFDGMTSQTNGDTITTYWRYAKLCPDVKPIIQWYKNTGEAPKCKKVLVRYNDGDIRAGVTEEFNWHVKYAIKDYAIIE
jgi:hypothetical protein